MKSAVKPIFFFCCGLLIGALIGSSTVTEAQYGNDFSDPYLTDRPASHPTVVYPPPSGKTTFPATRRKTVSPAPHPAVGHPANASSTSNAAITSVFSTAGGMIGLFSAAERKIYFYDSDLKDCKVIVAVDELGAPLRRIK